MWDFSSGFSLTNHFNLLGSGSIFGISQDPLMCKYASLSQDGFYWKGLKVEHHLALLLFELQGTFLYMCSQGGHWTSRMKNMSSLIFFLGGAQSLLSFILLLIFWSFGPQSCCCSVTQSYLTLCDGVDCSTQGFPVLHYLSALAQTCVHWVSDTIQMSHLLLSASPPTSSLSQHQGLLQRVSSSYQVAKVLEFQLQHQSFQWIFRVGFI